MFTIWYYLTLFKIKLTYAKKSTSFSLEDINKQFPAIIINLILSELNSYFYVFKKNAFSKFNYD